jgi:hypothetical protein
MRQTSMTPLHRLRTLNYYAGLVSIVAELLYRTHDHNCLWDAFQVFNVLYRG